MSPDESMDRPSSLLLVIPTVLEEWEGQIFFDDDFSNNLEAYLREFDTVTVACPAAKGSPFPGTRRLDLIPGWHRLRVVLLPHPYREDRYLLNRSAVGRLLSDEISSARYILISPHAPFDWSTLAAEICSSLGKKYNMEADANLPYAWAFLCERMPLSLNKLRKRLWMAYQTPRYWRCLRKSALALVQGEDVYNDYSTVGPNVYPVLNVQITDDLRITNSDLEAKLLRAQQNHPIKLAYAGRAIDIKGPMHWLNTLRLLAEWGIAYEATWVGDGELLGAMRAFVENHGLNCRLPGHADRGAVFELLREADLFMFCHMTKESPRCLVEALASAAPIVGFGSDFSRSLVCERGGGNFVNRGDSVRLADLVARYANDRAALATLIQRAFDSSTLLDRDKAIQRRIALIKQHL